MLLTFLATILAVLSEGLVPNSFEIIVDSNAVALFRAVRCRSVGVLGNCGSVDPGLLRGWLSLSNVVPGTWPLPEFALPLRILTVFVGQKRGRQLDLRIW